MPELILIVGHVGAGKTTWAKEYSANTGAVRLSPDEWMIPLFGEANPSDMRDIIEGRLIWTATEILRAGVSVVLDFGFWGRDERAALNWLAGTIGISTRTIYLPIDRETQATRIRERWSQSPRETWNVTQAELDEWRTWLQEPDEDELAGIYTVEPRIDSDWPTWITRRWPTAILPMQDKTQRKY